MSTIFRPPNSSKILAAQVAIVKLLCAITPVERDLVLRGVGKLLDADGAVPGTLAKFVGVMEGPDE